MDAAKILNYFRKCNKLSEFFVYLQNLPYLCTHKRNKMNAQSQDNHTAILHARLPYHEIRAPKDYIYYKVRVCGGLGGNALTDITRQRANAIKVLANLLQVSIQHQHVPLYLVRFEGGSSADEIPSSAEALVAIPADMDQDFKDIIIQGSCALQAQYGVSDPDVEVLLDAAVWHGNLIDELSTRCLLADINAIPTGPLEMHPDIAGAALTSNSIGCVSMLRTDSCFALDITSSSFKPADLALLTSKLRQILEVSGAEMIGC